METNNYIPAAAEVRFLKRLEECLRCASLFAVVFSAPKEGDVLKIRGSVKSVSGQTVLQLEYQCTEGRVRHENISKDLLGEKITPLFGIFKNAVIRHKNGGTGNLLHSKNGKATYTEDNRLREISAADPSSALTYAAETNNREKERMLTGAEMFLRELGIADANGRVRDKRQAKFRQICRFCEQIRDIMKVLPQEGVIRVADLCSGKSYLSFAVYYCLTELYHREVEMTCVDLKKSVMDECREIAERIGFSGMHFLSMNIDHYNPSENPHLVISLHACDIATDIVLRYAAEHSADVILSTPCCHRDLSRRIQCESLSFITDSPILRDKFSTAATDALRLLYLQAHGYKTDAIELIDPDDTPKNVLLRGIRNKRFSAVSKEAEAKRKAYAVAYRFLTGEDVPESFCDAGIKRIHY